MIVIVNLFLICLVPLVTYIVFSVVEGARNKVLTGLGGAVAFVLIVLLLPSANEKATQNASNASSAPYSTVTPREEAPTVGITLRNYKEKGDSVQLECSGSTGNITCKPKK